MIDETLEQIGASDAQTLSTSEIDETAAGSLAADNKVRTSSSPVGRTERGPALQESLHVDFGAPPNCRRDSSPHLTH